MRSYVVLLRGINVGGKNKVPMAELRACLEELECTDVRTLIASGNVVLRSSLGAAKLQDAIEAELPKRFRLDTELLRVLVLTDAKLRAIVADKPAGFGEHPDTYHSDAIFLMGITVREAMTVFQPREGVDEVWPGKGVVYSQRLSAQRTKSRLGKIVGTVPYQSMTIRSWNTTTRLVAMLDEDA
jgi:uncharacterized protein (DUF1697 family)